MVASVTNQKRAVVWFRKDLRLEDQVRLVGCPF